MNVRRLLLIHGFILLAAGVVLVVAPEAVPRAVDMPLSREQYLLCYFLAAGELAMAYLSFAGSRLRDNGTLRLIAQTMIMFHGATALLELLAFAQGNVGAKIFANVALRLIIMLLFGYYGWYRLRNEGSPPEL